MRWVRKLRTCLGQLDRDIGRKIAGNEELEAAFAVVRERVAKILTQKASSTDKLYALHAPEVECIAKGKARTRYEFGVKTSIAVTNARTAGGQFIVGMQALPGNPYDGHTLSGQIEQVERLTGVTVERAYVDRGYKGHKHGGQGEHVRSERTRFPVERDRGLAIASAFFEATKAGDTARLETLLADDVRFHSDGGGKRPAAGRILEGAAEVLRGLSAIFRLRRGNPDLVKTAFVNGLPGFVTREPDGILQTTALLVESDCVKAIYVMRNPDKLRHVEGLLH